MEGRAPSLRGYRPSGYRINNVLQRDPRGGGCVDLHELHVSRWKNLFICKKTALEKKLVAFDLQKNRT